MARAATIMFKDIVSGYNECSSQQRTDADMFESDVLASYGRRFKELRMHYCSCHTTSRYDSRSSNSITSSSRSSSSSSRSDEDWREKKMEHMDRMEHIVKRQDRCRSCEQLESNLIRGYHKLPAREASYELWLRLMYEIIFDKVSIKAIESNTWQQQHNRDRGHQIRMKALIFLVENKGSGFPSDLPFKVMDARDALRG